MNVTDALTRLDALEANSRHLRWHNRLVKGTLLVVLVSVLMLLVQPRSAGSAQDKDKEKKPRIVEANRFLLLDKAGQPRAGMIPGALGPSFPLHDEKGTFRASLSLTKQSSPTLTFRKGEEPPAIVLFATPEGTNGLLLSTAGKSQLVNFTRPGLAGLSIVGPTGNDQVLYTIDPYGPELSLWDAVPRKRVSLSHAQDETRLAILDDKGQIDTHFPPSITKPSASAEATHLALLPPQAIFFATADVTALGKTSFVEQVMKTSGSLIFEAVGAMLSQEFSKAGSIARVTAFATLAEEYAFIWSTEKSYDRQTLLRQMGGRPVMRAVRGRAFYVHQGDVPLFKAFAFLDDRTILQGSEKAIQGMLARYPGVPANSPLTELWKQVTAKSSICAGIHLPSEARMAMQQSFQKRKDARPDWAEELAVSTLSANALALRIDVDPTLKLLLDVNCADDKSAERVLGQYKRAHPRVREFFAAFPKTLEKTPFPRLVLLFQRFESSLPDVAFTREASQARVAMPIKLNEEFFREFNDGLLDLVAGVRDAAARMKSTNNMKLVGLAMHNYEATHGHFPLPASLDKDGKPLLSWRVHLLPFLEEDALYKRFRLDEPWDSPHNAKLIPLMPKVFEQPPKAEEAGKPGHTHYQVFVGPGAMFEHGKKVTVASVKDGLSNTILLAEAREAVPWTKPSDLPFSPDKRLPPLGGRWVGDYFLGLWADGSARAFSLKLPEKTLRMLITHAGGEIIPAGALD